MKEVPLSRGMVALVDDEDFDRVNAFKWCAIRALNGKFYAHRRRSHDNPYVSMHRFVVGAGRGQVVDHRHGNTLDNRRENLRVCTGQQNGWNRSADRRSRTGFKGVHYFAPMGKWQAHIRVNNRKMHLGYHATVEDAAKAYDAAAVKHFGEFAKTNFTTANAHERS
jgi:hypothetical protein